jgi:hypothetical protein
VRVGIRAEARRAGAINLLPGAHEPGAGCRFLRIRQREGHTTALFRAPRGSGSSYREVYLFEGRKGAVRTADVYIYDLGDTLGRLQGCMLDVDSTTTGAMLLELTSLLRGGHARKALEAYAALPSDVRTLKMFLEVRRQAAAGVGKDAHESALDDFAELYPNDPAMPFVDRDRCYLQRDFEGFRQAVDAMDRMVGGDPYLNVLRANAYVAEGNLPAARKAAEAAVAGEPGLPKTHWTLVDVALLQRDFAEVARTLTRMESQLGVVLRDLRLNPAFADFFASPEGLAWLARDAADAK